MKTIFLVRHAKSSWKDPTMSDFDRPLNNRGKKDATFMGELLKKKLINPDLILSSPANRAKRTAIEVASIVGFSEDKIIFKNEIYEATLHTLLNLIKEIDERFNSVMIFGHNPGLTIFHNFICNKYIENIPTCGVAASTFAKRWSECEKNSFEFLFFEYPKKYKL